MANANGSRIMVNLHKKKRTHLLFHDKDGRFDPANPPTVDVKGSDDADATQILTFDLKAPRVHSKHRMTLRIIFKSKKRVKAADPASGNLTVTITSVGMNVPTDPIPVNYIDDPDGCDD